MGRTMPSKCPHGFIFDWGDFGCECGPNGLCRNPGKHRASEHCPQGCNDREVHAFFVDPDDAATIERVARAVMDVVTEGNGDDDHFAHYVDHWRSGAHLVLDAAVGRQDSRADGSTVSGVAPCREAAGNLGPNVRTDQRGTDGGGGDVMKYLESTLAGCATAKSIVVLDGGGGAYRDGVYYMAASTARELRALGFINDQAVLSEEGRSRGLAAIARFAAEEAECRRRRYAGLARGDR